MIKEKDNRCHKRRAISLNSIKTRGKVFNSTNGLKVTSPQMNIGQKLQKPVWPSFLAPKMRRQLWFLFLLVFVGNLVPGDGFGFAVVKEVISQAEEVISIIKIGANLVKYIYNVFSSITVTYPGFFPRRRCTEYDTSLDFLVTKVSIPISNSW